jgi:hypothetical protein
LALFTDRAPSVDHSIAEVDKCGSRHTLGRRNFSKVKAARNDMKSCGGCWKRRRPAWGTKPFPKQDRAGRFVTLASSFETDHDALPIRAEARVLGATLNRGQSLTYDTEAGRFLYLVPSAGTVNVNGFKTAPPSSNFVS